MKRKLKGLLGVVTAVATLLSTVGTIPAMAAEKTEVENNDSMDKAMLISVNEEVTGNLSDKNDKDYYKFELPADGYISLTFSHEYTSNYSDRYWESYIYDSEGNNVIVDSKYGVYLGNNKDDSTGMRIGLSKGNYFVYIEHSSFWSSVGYTFTVNYTNSSTYETEFNDTFKTADEISVNTEIGGNINNVNDSDYYKIDIQADGYISLTFSHGFVNDSDKYWESSIFDSEGNSVIPYECYERYSGEYKDNYTGRRIGLPKGSYYVKVSNSASPWFSWGNYIFTVNYTESSAYEREGNDTIKQANDVAVNTKTGGGIMTNDDADWYRFSIPEDGNISVTFGHDYYKNAWESSSYYKIWFNDVDGNNLFGNNAYAGYKGYEKEEITGSVFGLPAGTYYMKIAKGDYSLISNYGFTINYDTPDLGWVTMRDGKAFWYEGKVRQGTYDDPKGVLGDGTVRGREICDNSILDANGNGTWFWLDSVYDGAKAVGKEVWMPYIYQDEANWDDATKANIAAESDYGMEGMGRCVLDAINNKAGKWVRYDNEGKMLKGWVEIKGDLAKAYPDQVGNKYYYDTRTGLMAKGWVKIDGVDYYFDETSGVLQ